ncbi:hypothetical protein [Gimesia maris]|uniref:Uncharacterized protein n=1 Tax=Gimesia maris TaxID=122 RepID=A0ABX5YIU2_9PLAN|nr:hypothetical protein [Gimesia maris]EDL57305.1 hypothetical protein PM8797T_16835 [Gimesia maris DSM 8797]QEG15569.1 hypothetical protein GmarT_14100 [Gimesia maris]QGQ31135.1 hypothetical protein F1729_22250 [Gimesia maris]
MNYQYSYGMKDATPATVPYPDSLSISPKCETFKTFGSHKNRPIKLNADVLGRTGRVRSINGQMPLYLVSCSGNFENDFAFCTQHDEIDAVVISAVLSPVESFDALAVHGQAGALFVPIAPGGILNVFSKHANKHQRNWTSFALGTQGLRLSNDSLSSKRYLPAYDILNRYVNWPLMNSPPLLFPK